MFKPATRVESVNVFGPALRSFMLAAGIAAVAVVAGWIPGSAFGGVGTSRKQRDVLLWLLLMPLVLPQYVLYYAWSLLLSPTTALGSYVSARPELARFVGTVTSVFVLILWYWPLAALVLAHGWRNIDRQLSDSASLDAGAVGAWRHVTLPLMRQSIVTAFLVCFVLALSEFATFHLAGVRTIGTELAVLYELTGSEIVVARSAWPVVIVALIVAIIVARASKARAWHEAVIETTGYTPRTWQWIVLVSLLGFSVAAPVALLVLNIADMQALRQFLTLHSDDLAWSMLIAVVAAAMACLIGYGVSAVDVSGRFCRTRKIAGLIVRGTVFAAMFLPASVVAVAMLRFAAICDLPSGLRQSWLFVSLGQAGRFAGLAFVVFLFARSDSQRALSEMASLDGASRSQTWWYVHLPQTWPLFVGTFILLVMFSLTELSATMVLLPAGLPNFSQRLLNQMHYARDQHVIASCLVMIGLFAVMAVGFVLLLRVVRLRRAAMTALLCMMIFSIAGCWRSRAGGQPKVLHHFGRTGRGQCEFVYPRAIDIADDGSLFVVDKTGRIQRLSAQGEFLGVIQMPQIEAGKPTGITVGPDGNLYVADTHYHRVMVFSTDGQLVRQFGQYGQDGGCFIYPTDVAFSPDGNIYVSEYGGNDRISVFDREGRFLHSFGTPGSGTGQLSRPAAMCVDGERGRLYVADACNHRIAVYDLQGRLQRYIGSAGCEPGQLRYPYGLAMSPDGTLVVCEFGNNRLQLFDRDGRSVGVYGQAGRQLGQLAFPWSVVVDRSFRAFVVDAGNNRIQVWQL